ncbi:unnamed protein product, partial [Cuscuta epithymum]
MSFDLPSQVRHPPIPHLQRFCTRFHGYPASLFTANEINRSHLLLNHVRRSTTEIREVQKIFHRFSSGISREIGILASDGMCSIAASLNAAHPFTLPAWDGIARISGPPTHFWEQKKRRLKKRELLRATAVEARPRKVPAIRDRSSDNGNVSLQSLQRSEVTSSPLRSSCDLADDMQAEASAVARAANASVYSPQLLFSKYGSRPIKTVSRAFEILLGLCSFALKLWLDKLNGHLNQNRRLRAVELRQIFTSLGPTFVKIGQGLSTRPDLCPPEFLEELSKLQ